ncbi:outer membrane protein [Salmonella enterica subsp. enterica]|uniref:Outer membrane protein n=25 Tax=Salmonella enterica TaxID=28901 RepID=A0A379UNB0_SALET|nr:outer membrane protein [Salmonella enterica subsp. enterica]
MINLSIVKLMLTTPIHLLKVITMKNVMKNVKNLIAAAVLSSLSFASFAAVEVQATPEGQQKFGTISANGGTNLGSLEDQLAQKAEEMGAKSFRITSVTGPNTLHGTAVIYK